MTLQLPNVAFNRRVGAFAAIEASPEGKVMTTDEWERSKSAYLPTDSDAAHVRAVMQPVFEPGRIASWIAPPRSGIHSQPFEYDYVHFS